MKDEEQQLMEEINDLKKKMSQDKKNKDKPMKKESPKKEEKASKKDSSEPKSFSLKKVFISALPFLLIIVFIVGFIAGSAYEKGQANKQSTDSPVIQGNQDSPAVTGQQTGTQSQPKPQQEPAAPKNDCIDTDQGAEKYVKGEVYFNTAIYFDKCENASQLREYTCNPDTTMASQLITCEVCEDGACLLFEDRREGCRETDNYVDYFNKGYVKDKKGRVEVDKCSRNSLEEWFCDIYGFAAKSYTLCEKCEDGACVKAEQEEPKCTDTDGGIKFYVKGSVVDANGRTGEDNCQSRTLEEYYCSPLGYIEKTYKLCTQCVEGACVQTE